MARLGGLRAATHASPRVGTPDDVAGLVAFLMSEQGECINGQVINIDGGTVLR
jgi:NAD(P)-dependent dehydrogenase (short-subunit alcohol dehydrogenase family)